MCLALKATGSVLLHLQWDGSTEQRKFGLSVRTSSPAWSASTSTTFLVSGRDLRGPGVAMAPLPSTILLQGKDVEGGVNRLVVGGSTGICITTAWVSATWLGCLRRAGHFGRMKISFSKRRWSQSPECESAEDGGECARSVGEESLSVRSAWDVSAGGTSGSLCRSLTSGKITHKKRSSKSLSAQSVFGLIWRTLDGQPQPRVDNVSTPQTTELTLKNTNQSINPNKRMIGDQWSVGTGQIIQTWCEDLCLSRL